jgi:hypothetical protein
MFTAILLGVGLQLAPQPAPSAPLSAPLIPTPAEVGAAAASGSQETVVEYSDFYYRRLDIHRWASYAMLPLFAAQYIAGSELAKGGEKADWAEDLHPTLALGVGALFTVNTVTGAWNLWEGRKDPEGRKWRTTHAVLMMLADAGFVATAILADEAEDDGSGVGAHRTMAITSFAVSTASWMMMLDVFRPD